MESVKVQVQVGRDVWLRAKARATVLGLTAGSSVEAALEGWLLATEPVDDRDPTRARVLAQAGVGAWLARVRGEDPSAIGGAGLTASSEHGVASVAAEHGEGASASTAGPSAIGSRDQAAPVHTADDHVEILSDLTLRAVNETDRSRCRTCTHPQAAHVGLTGRCQFGTGCTVGCRKFVAPVEMF